MNLIAVDFDALQRISERYDTSDEYDDLEYCVNDLLPETRGDTELTQRVATMVRKWRNAND